MSKTLEELLAENEQLKIQLQEEKEKLSSAIEQLEESKKELTDSISYAERIQGAIMPPISYVKSVLPKSFILYLPKDVVSGDFYFVEQVGDEVIFAAVDCTGHGVPGALMSVVGFNYLHQAVTEKHITKPSEILSFLDAGVNERLRQTDGASGVNDGMDLGLCTWNTKTNVLQYAGAYNPLYVVSNGEIIEIKADKFPIGVNTDGTVDEYTNHCIQLKEGDCVYLFSDGYADQFGGEKGKKFKYKQLRNTLIELNNLTMPEQKNKLSEIFEVWKGSHEQIDDVLLMGIRI